MGTTADKLNKILESKESIKNAINKNSSTTETSNEIHRNTSDSVFEFSETFVIRNGLDSEYYIDGELATIIDVPEFYSEILSQTFPSFKGLETSKYSTHWQDHGMDVYSAIYNLDYSSEPKMITITIVKKENLIKDSTKLSEYSSIIENNLLSNKEIDALIMRSELEKFVNNRVGFVASSLLEYSPKLTHFEATNMKILKTSALQYCDKLKSVNIPACYEIRDDGMRGCIALETLEMLGGTDAEPVKVGNSSFESCTSLRQLVAPKMGQIGQNAFKNCVSLESVDYPNARVGQRAFSGCSALQSVTVSGEFGGVDSLTTGTGGDSDSGNNVFENCNNLVNIKLTKATAVNHVQLTGTTIDEKPNLQVFEAPLATTITNMYWLGNLEPRDASIPNSSLVPSCPQLVAVNMPNLSSSQSLGYRLFTGYKKLAMVNTGAARVGGAVFNESSIRRFMGSPQSFGDSAFLRCNQLVMINSYDSGTWKFAEGLKTIGASAFENCTGAVKVYFPISLNEIKSNAFSGCTSITDVYYAGTEAEWNAITIGSNNSNITDARIHYTVNY